MSPVCPSMLGWSVEVSEFNPYVCWQHLTLNTPSLCASYQDKGIKIQGGPSLKVQEIEVTHPPLHVGVSVPCSFPVNLSKAPGLAALLALKTLHTCVRSLLTVLGAVVL
jgi:hypothetical protein